MCKIKLPFYLYRYLLTTPQQVGDIMSGHFLAEARGQCGRTLNISFVIRQEPIEKHASSVERPQNVLTTW